MRQSLVAGVAAVCGLVLIGTAEAKAIAIRPSSIPERVAQSDVVVVGKVGKVEPKNVSAAPFPGGQKVEYQVVALEVKDGLLGARGKKEIRLGFIPPQQGGPGGGPGPIRRPGGFRQLVFTQGQEGLFFLTKHPTESFCVAPAYFSFVDKNAGDFGKQVEQVKKCTKLLSDPMASLKSKSADDRAQTAAMLVLRYRAFKPGKMKEEEIGAEESKLILNALAEGDWSKGFSPTEITPQMAFGQLGLTPNDGWKPGPFKNYQQEFPEAAKKWLKENAGKYRIKKRVPDTKG